MNRRSFLRAAMTGVGALSCPLFGATTWAQDAMPGWRVYEVTTELEIQRPAGRTRVWVPMALEGRVPFQRVLATTVTCAQGKSRMLQTGEAGTKVLQAEFSPGSEPVLRLTQRIATRDWQVDLHGPMKPGTPEQPTGLQQAEVRRSLQPTAYVPIDGLVKQRADEITQGRSTDVEKAQAVYTWVVENTYRDARARGCGRGDVRSMLASGELGGKCADLNALFVGLLRAAGVPARDVYGVRVGPSQKGLHSLGTATEDSTRAQHCRAEVFLAGHGWAPMDPADVRKVLLEERPGALSLQSACVQAVRERLFGSWEMNWVAFNYGQDVVLPGSAGPALPFFMYPVVETDEGRLDSLDPGSLRYTITARPLPADRV